MADGVTIDQLNQADSAEGSDLIEIQRGNQSMKVTASQIASLGGGGSGAGNNTFTGKCTFTQPLTVADPTDPNHAVNKKYVDNQKYAVVCVAGQSNAVGYDESPVDHHFYSNGANYRRVKQLGFYGDDNLKLVPLTHCAQSYQDMRGFTNPANPDLRGPKGMHLPLAMELLKYIPADRDILIVPCAYGGTGFTSGKAGTYDESTKKPSADARQWGVNTPFYKAMKARIKHVLDLNEENTFLGVIWLQGENDKSNAAGHYSAFQEMTEDFFTDMNRNYANRVKKGVWDRDLWLNVETVSYWYTQGQCAQIWANYKTWNPKSYIEVDRNAPSNEVNGTGATASVRAAHFGNNAYNKFVVPGIIKYLIQLNFPSIFAEVMDARGIEFHPAGTNGVLESKNVNSAITEVVNKLSSAVNRIVDDESTVSTATVNASVPSNQWLMSRAITISANSKGTKLRVLCRHDINSQPNSTMNVALVDAESNQILKKISTGTYKRDGSYSNRFFFEMDFTNDTGKNLFLGFQSNERTFNALAGRSNSAYMGELTANVGTVVPASNVQWLPEFILVHEENVPGEFMGGYISVQKLKQITAASSDFNQFKSQIASL